MTIPSQRRIAIVGNMNNNGFSLLRYFHDLGEDAHLFPYSTDSVGNLAHFGIESDTWSPERWRSRITILPIQNSSRSLYPALFPVGPKRDLVRKISRDFDVTIGSGIAPALFSMSKCRLSAFYPYSIGVELLGQPQFLHSIAHAPLKRPLYRYAQTLQRRGILEAGRCFNAELSLTKQSLENIGRSFDRLAVPMVYNRERPEPSVISAGLAQTAARVRHHNFVVFCHSRHLWVRDPALTSTQFGAISKNSDWLLRGFADFVRDGATDAVLVTIAYGPDVEASKLLARELGIQDRVIWLPKMKRREILYLLDHIDVGVGEFYTSPGTIWGGTGWEILASGKPLLQAFNFTPEGFQEAFGHPSPPLVHADSPTSVASQLRKLYAQPALRLRIGSESAAWFEMHNGIGLARRWLDLIDTED